MELQDYYATLREKYQIIMSKFTYTGKEPEDKERLRYLLLNQRISFSSLAPEPQDWNEWTEECIRREDWPGLCRIINQRGKGAMLPVIYGSYTYEKNFHCMLECFVCGNVQAMERILPPELAQVKNYYQPFFPIAAHLLIGLWYRDDAVLAWAAADTEQFLTQKKPNRLEKSMVAFLLDLAGGDMAKGSEHLQEVCKAYPRDKKYFLGARPFCTLAHGLYCLAQILLPEETFRELEMPSYKNFLPEFARWRREHSQPDLSLWIRYPEDLAVFNGIYEAPPARLVLKPPAPEDKKQEWFAHGVKWVGNYVDELWDLGVGQA